MRDPTRYAAIIAWILALVIVMFVASMCGNCQAVELSISGHSAGMGLHALSFSGDLLNATILQGGNSSTWLINATGSMGAS